jgi:hypothetical protein
LAVISTLCFLVTATVAWGEVVPAMSGSAPATSQARHSTPRLHRAKASTHNRMTLLFGRKRVGPSVPTKRAGSADAFRFTEKVAGTARAISVYVTTPSTSKTLVAGLYTDGGGVPSVLLATGSASVPKSGRWVTVPIARTSLTQGGFFWIAVLGKNGTLDPGGRRSASCRAVTERQAGLTALPRRWSPGAALNDCISAYVSGRQITHAPLAGTNSGNSAPTGGAGAGGGTNNTVSPPAQPTSLPVNTAVPTITGTLREGSTLTASAGSWTGTPSSYAYQWQDCTSSSSCTNISGATSNSYTLQASDVGMTVNVMVTAVNAGGPASASSAHTAIVQTPTTPAPTDAALPTVTGTARQGQRLTASNGSWSGSPTAYAYQWQHCSSSPTCSNISGATSSSYSLQAADVGDMVDVVVTATNAGGSASATSAQTSIVQTLPAPANTVAPVISGTPQEGDTLTATSGTWSNTPTSFAYQWQDCSSPTSCSNISGANASSYTLQASDVGATVDVVVAATNAGGSASAASAQTTAVQSPPAGGGGSSPANTALPTVAGNTLEGDTLTATSGTWSNSPTSYGYQWQDCIGATCSNITGATTSDYTIQSSDVGHSLAVVVTATNSSGSTGASSFNTAAATSGSNSNGLVSAAYLLGFSPPSGCSSLNATCISTTDPPNWNAITEANVFALVGENPASAGATTATVTGTITSIPASVTTTIPAGPIMLTTSSSNPASGSYQILQTSGAASGATSIPITGSPSANATYASGSAVMVQGLNSSQNSVPTGSTLTALTTAIHNAGAKALISIGGSNDVYWNSDCADGFQYLLGATLAHYILAGGFDGVELDTEQGTSSTWGACWAGAAEEIHAVATGAGQVPIVYADVNQSLGSEYYPAASASKAQVDQFVFFYYGYDPANNYNCADSCNQLATYLSQVTGGTYNIPAAKWLAGQGVAGAGGASQQSTTVLSTTTASASGAVTSIPVSALSASLPAGTFVLATAGGLPPTNYEILETSGAASGATSIPVTGYCTAAAWTLGASDCVSAASVTLNASYASGDDIYMDSTGYGTGGANYGGWDCGNNAAYAAAHGMLGVMEWFDSGSGDTNLCFDQIQPFVSGGLG